MLIYDRESNDIVEDFPVISIQQPVAFSHSNHIYDNILMFTVQHPKEAEGELLKVSCLVFMRKYFKKIIFNYDVTI